MTVKQFNELYNDSDFNKRIKALANRYYTTYSKQFEVLAFDQYDVEQELWIDIYEAETDNKKKLMKRVIDRVFNMLRDSGAQIRAVDDVDLASLAYENENGEIETDDEVMARLVYSGRGRYV